MTPWIRLTLPLAAISLHACVPTPEEVATTSDVVSSSGSTSEGPGPSTTPGTTMPGEDTVGTQGATGMDTTMGAVDSTNTSTSTSVGETTMGVDPSTSSGGGESSSTGEPPPPPECVVPTDCPNNETCNAMGECESVCLGGWGMGSYDYCLSPLGTVNNTLCGPESYVCGISGDPVETATCVAQGCTTACDCPAPPATGQAVVSCGNLTVNDMAPDCFLSCANGELCPDGMECRVGTLQTYCAQPVQPLDMYGNCDDIAAPCANGGTCATSGSYSVCVSLCPSGIGDCDPAPVGADFGTACAPIISPPNGDDCYLPCNNGGDCPAGMSCIDGGFGTNLCMWP